MSESFHEADDKVVQQVVYIESPQEVEVTECRQWNSEQTNRVREGSVQFRDILKQKQMIRVLPLVLCSEAEYNCEHFKCVFFLIIFIIPRSAVLPALLTSSFYLIIYRSRDSAVGIATGYGLDDRGVGVRVPVGSRSFSSPRRPDRSAAHPASYPMCTRGFFPGGKAAGV
jgi:hypothetical protein